MPDKSSNWREVARFMLLSRELDELEEKQLVPDKQPRIWILYNKSPALNAARIPCDKSVAMKSCRERFDIGIKLKGVARERVRQIEAQALNRLRHPSNYRKLHDYLGE